MSAKSRSGEKRSRRGFIETPDTHRNQPEARLLTPMKNRVILPITAFLGHRMVVSPVRRLRNVSVRRRRRGARKDERPEGSYRGREAELYAKNRYRIRKGKDGFGQVLDRKITGNRTERKRFRGPAAVSRRREWAPAELVGGGGPRSLHALDQDVQDFG